jgi:NADPH2:quinone reductase
MPPTPLPDTMRAVVLDAVPAPPEGLAIRTLPVPEPRAGQVLIKVMAFGLNRSELQTRLGLAGAAVTLPRVPGIEACGVVVACPGGELEPGTQVAAMMGGMGRSFDGGYAEYTQVPVAQVIAFRSALPWATLGAVPETLQTANGALTTGLGLQPGQTLLLRPGTSAIGMTATVLAKRLGATVIASTRDEAKMKALKANGADEVLVDDGTLAPRVRALVGDGVDAVLEQIGTPTLADSLRAVRRHGTVCTIGALSNRWLVPDFDPTAFIPNGARLTGYSGDAANLPAAVLQDYLDAVAAGEAAVPISKTYRLDEIVQAHADMEANRATGKLVVDLS